MERMKRLPCGHWINGENQRLFLLQFAKKMNIKTPDQWGKVTARMIKDNGGSSLLQRFEGSPCKLLRAAFPEQKFEELWFSNIKLRNKKHPKGFWRNKKNQRTFVIEMAKKMNIRNPRDWGNVSVKSIKEQGGAGILSIFGSRFKMLQSVLPETKFEKEWFWKESTHPHGYWNNKDHQRDFLFQFAKKMNIKKPQDWGRISSPLIKEHGGVTLIERYGNSMWKLLRSAFPETQWKREWFYYLSIYPSYYWNNPENSRRFIEKIAVDYNIKDPIDWKRLSVGLIRNKGGEGLLKRHGGSLLSVLSALYPHMNWMNDAKDYQSSSQRVLVNFVKSVLPSANLFVNFKSSK